MSNAHDNDLRDLYYDVTKSTLHHYRPSVAAVTAPTVTAPAAPLPPRLVRVAHSIRRDHTVQEQAPVGETTNLSRERQARPDAQDRAALPVHTKAEDFVKHIEENDVTTCMAATGSGKTTQVPQLILDRHIDKGERGRCNIICTQPRSLVAISVADRVAKERGETVGQSVGYTVRFESCAPELSGSITLCTIGLFLKKLQSGLVGNSAGSEWFNIVEYTIVDEVHERDVDTDVMLVASRCSP